MALPSERNGCSLWVPNQIGSNAEMPLSPSLLLLLAVNDQIYALDSAAVLEVIPRVMLRSLSDSPPHLPGVFSFRGRVVPVLDMSQLIAGRVCAANLSSRIIMVRMADDALVGLLAERVTDTVLKSRDAFQPAEGAAATKPWLGGIALDERGLIQMLDVDALTRLVLGVGETPEALEAGGKDG